MSSKFNTWVKIHPIAKFIYPVLIIFFITSSILALNTGSNYKLPAIIFLLLLLYIFRPHSLLYASKIESITWEEKLIAIITALITIVTCIAPMGANPNFSDPSRGNHRNEYSNITESFLAGHLDFDYGDEDEMLRLNNPYNPKEREAAGIASHWDHAYYNNHYYMYFGVVPVFLVFMPYRIITGQSLPAYVGTQIFAIFVILGFFTLFYYLSRRYFKKLPFVSYLMLSISFSIISIWYSIVHAPLYCTAIISAVALAIWSLYFFIRALYDSDKRHQTVFLIFGAIFGSLTFGCRPTIALFNIILLPFLILFIKQRGFNPKTFSKICLAILPYIIVGISLMWYNYIRFDNPFEFGQTYQITLRDQTTGELAIGQSSILRVINELPVSFFKPQKISSTFPWLTTGNDSSSSFSGIFFIFPIFILSFAIFNRKVFALLKRTKLSYLIFGLLIAIIVISIMDIIWSPFPLERYHLDIYFLVGIITFAVIGFWYQTLSKKSQNCLRFIIVLFTLFTIVTVFLLCMVFLQQYLPDTALEIGQKLHIL